jgi:hypothetical protein
MDTASCRSLTGQCAALVSVLTCAASIVCLLAGCSGTNSTAGLQRPSPSPFSLSIVAGKSITMSKKAGWADEFFVVLTNISREPQPVFEYWNEWGYQVVSFELTTGDAKRFMLTVKNQDFDKNSSDTYSIEPGEQQVFAIRFDDLWQLKPALTVVDGMPITLRAVYQVKPTRESTREHVWTGRVDSHSYSLSLWQCPPSCSPLFTHGVRP